MQLKLRQESEPVDPILLVFPKLSLDLHGHLVLLDLAPIKELRQEGALLVPPVQQLFGEVGRIGEAGLSNRFLTVGFKRSVRDRYTSRGTIFTRDANVFVAVVRTSSSTSLMRPRIGTIKKIM